MAPRARRLAILAAAGAATLAFSGCHEILRVTLGGDDPPVHNPPPAGRTASADAAAGRPFEGRADGELFGYKLRHGFVKTTLKAGYIGNYKSDLTGSPLASGKWHARFKAVRNRATGKIVITGLVLSTFTDTTAGRACLKLTSAANRKQNRRRVRRGRGKVSVVGGEGAARTLYGTARARVRLKRNGSARLRGRMRSHQGEERGFTRACKRLERKFGLDPLPDA
jgi:hypothetical protein